MDHIVDTFPERDDTTAVPGGQLYIEKMREATECAGVKLFDLDDDDQGIVHVLSPELGIALPGTTIVCPDSHTCTLGALGALAWGIGSTEGEHALATQTLVVRRPKTMKVVFEEEIGPGITAKDMILHLIGKYSAAGGSGYAIEFCGSAIQSLDVEARLTLCNMAVEFSAWTGLIAPDDKAFEFVKGRDYAPKSEHWENALMHWKSLQSDEDASFDKTLTVRSSEIAPTVTWGTSPGHAVSVSGLVPDPQDEGSEIDRGSKQRALEYMNIEPGQAVEGLAIEGAFIGSCTNSRISDLRSAAKILKGRKVAKGVHAICVPGSGRVKAQAEREGLDKVFLDSGFEWRAPGCSMCFFAGGESMGAGKRVISSTNRNFEGRQGLGTRTHLASPATVAASAISGAIADPRKFGV